MLKCFVRGVLRSVRSSLKTMNFVWMDGHSFEEVDTQISGNKIVETLRCSECGKISEGWRYK